MPEADVVGLTINQYFSHVRFNVVVSYVTSAGQERDRTS